MPTTTTSTITITITTTHPPGAYPLRAPTLSLRASILTPIHHKVTGLKMKFVDTVRPSLQKTTRKRTRTTPPLSAPRVPTPQANRVSSTTARPLVLPRSDAPPSTRAYITSKTRARQHIPSPQPPPPAAHSSNMSKHSRRRPLLCRPCSNLSVPLRLEMLRAAWQTFAKTSASSTIACASAFAIPCTASLKLPLPHQPHLCPRRHLPPPPPPPPPQAPTPMRTMACCVCSIRRCPLLSTEPVVCPIRPAIHPPAPLHQT
mmetsp:Transcript_12951/g.21176  ORF Transcript_12951/g.21176 Transcript_12951/m.21176 type:complete len:259 (-) Transcript_12951:973-1749(-)